MVLRASTVLWLEVTTNKGAIVKGDRLKGKHDLVSCLERHTVPSDGDLAVLVSFLLIELVQLVAVQSPFLVFVHLIRSFADSEPELFTATVLLGEGKQLEPFASRSDREPDGSRFRIIWLAGHVADDVVLVLGGGAIQNSIKKKSP